MTELTMEVEKEKVETPQAEVQVGERIHPRRILIPRVDILESGDDVVLMVDMPGVDESNVDITIEKDQLTVRGRVEDQLPENYKSVYAEYRVGDYERTFSLSDDMDRDRVTATLKHGVLRLTLAKAEAAKARKIAIHPES